MDTKGDPIALSKSAAAETGELCPGQLLVRPRPTFAVALVARDGPRSVQRSIGTTPAIHKDYSLHFVGVRAMRFL